MGMPHQGPYGQPPQQGGPIPPGPPPAYPYQGAPMQPGYPPQSAPMRPPYPAAPAVPPPQQQFQQLPGQPPPPVGGPAGGQDVVVDVGQKATRQVLLGGIAGGAIGLLCLIAAVTGQVNGGTGATVVVVILGLIFGSMGVFTAAKWKALSRPRKLIFNVHGVTFDDPAGKPWSVRWEELSTFAISRTKQRAVKATDYVGRRILVRIDLFPAEVNSFRQRHPEMEHMYGFHRVQDGGYRMPLGHAPDFIPMIEHGVRSFRPQVFGGVRDEGFMVGIH